MEDVELFALAMGVVKPWLVKKVVRPVESPCV